MEGLCKLLELCGKCSECCGGVAQASAGMGGQAAISAANSDCCCKLGECLCSCCSCCCSSPHSPGIVYIVPGDCNHLLYCDCDQQGQNLTPEQRTQRAQQAQAACEQDKPNLKYAMLADLISIGVNITISQVTDDEQMRKAAYTLIGLSATNLVMNGIAYKCSGRNCLWNIWHGVETLAAVATAWNTSGALAFMGGCEGATSWAIPSLSAWWRGRGQPPANPQPLQVVLGSPPPETTIAISQPSFAPIPVLVPLSSFTSLSVPNSAQPFSVPSSSLLSSAAVPSTEATQQQLSPLTPTITLIASSLPSTNNTQSDEQPAIPIPALQDTAPRLTAPPSSSSSSSTALTSIETTQPSSSSGLIIAITPSLLSADNTHIITVSLSPQDTASSSAASSSSSASSNTTNSSKEYNSDDEFDFV